VSGETSRNENQNMKTLDSSLFNQLSHRGIAIACVAALFVLAFSVAHAQQDQIPAPATASEESPPIPADQLDSLVAPIAIIPTRC